MEREQVRAVEQGAVLVTATQRLARRLGETYARAQAAAGRECWPTPAILPWTAWVGAAWEGAWPDAAVLPEPLSLVLWEEAVAQDAAARGAAVLDVAATARLAREAYELLHLYRIPLAPDPLDSAEVAAFGRWRAAYEAELEQGGWVDRAHLPGRVAALVAAGSVPAPPALLLAGFDELPPAQGRLLQALEERGTRVERVPFPARRGRVVRYGAPDGPEEVRAAALWVRRLLLGGVPTDRIGVACAGLEAYGAWVERIFAEELVPASVLPGAGPEGLPFDVSFGAPLAREPVAATALDLLALGPGAEGWELWTSLLRSPFWGGAEEGLGRAALDAGLSRGREPVLTAGAVARRARQAGLGETASALDALLAAWGTPGGRQAPSAWAEGFRDALETCGWSRARGLSSREYQARQAFWEALARLRGFDALGGARSRAWALERVRRLCAEPFRPEVPQAAVPVLGHLQAAGLAFDHHWVLGLHGRALPPGAAPNPFLPYALQTAHGVREASPEAQLELSRRFFSRLLASADEVVASHPATWDGTPVAPSPLVLGLPEGRPVLAEPAALRETLRRHPVALEEAPDAAPPLEPGFEIRRGAELLADQAACPFRAFARHRLEAEGVEVPDPALDALERGIAVHRALEVFWERVPGSEEARALTVAELEEALSRAVAAGLGALEQGRSALPPRVRELEGRRLGGLLREWLARELEGEPFRVVAREERREASLGPLRVRVRVDRVDEAAGGRLLLLDYKTGTPKPSRWLEERPREPQLPLYALACPEATGVAYAVVRRGGCGRRGVAETDGGLEGLPGDAAGVETWEDLRRLWQGRLEALAREVAEGRAEVCPVEPEVCRYCELPALCRVVEAGAEGEVGTEAGEGGGEGEG